MPALQFTADFFSSTATASFREWTANLHATITSAGFSDTLSSGSITVGMTQSIPAGLNAAVSGFNQLTPMNTANASAGYVIYQFNDPLSGSVPIFFKVEFGCSNPQAGPSIWITAATSHSNSPTGTMTVGQFTTRKQVGASSPTAGDRLVGFVGGSTGSLPYITVVMPTWDLTTQLTFATPAAFGIERTTNAAGTASLDGFIVWTAAGTVHSTQIVPASGSIPAIDAALRGTIGSFNPATFQGKNIAYALFSLPGISILPMLSIVAVSTTAIRDTDTFIISVIPTVPRTYLKINNLATIDGVAGTSLALLWE